MIGVKQTLRGAPDAPPGRRGNCFGAVLASILEVPMEQIPNPPKELDITVHDSSAWWDHYAKVLLEYGYMMMNFDFRSWWDWLEENKPGMIWHAGVPSLNIAPTEAVPRPLHALVMQDTDVIWDPSRAKTYGSFDSGGHMLQKDDIVDGNFFIALNPAKAGS